MIRLLDRYLLGTFLSALAVFLAAFVFLFVTIDFASNLGRFLELKSVSLLPFIGEYYLIRIPLFLTLLLPMVVLFAAMFTVIKLARTNEILPIAASGTSLRRMALPFLVAGVAAAAVMGAIDEFVLPALGGRIEETEELRNAKEVSWKVSDRDAETRILGNRYDHVKREMSTVTVTHYDAGARPVREVQAARGHWDAGLRRWVVFDGEIVWLREEDIVTPKQGKPRRRREPIPPGGYVVEALFTPESLTRSGSWTTRFACATIRSLLDAARKNPDVPTHVMKVHSRLAFPVSPLVLLLLGLPFVIAAQSKSFLRGLFVCLVLSLSYYMTHFACQELGNLGNLPPLWAGWGPTAAFGLVGLGAFARMRT